MCQTVGGLLAASCSIPSNAKLSQTSLLHCDASAFLTEQCSVNRHLVDICLPPVYQNNYSFACRLPSAQCETLSGRDRHVTCPLAYIDSGHCVHWLLGL